MRPALAAHCCTVAWCVALVCHEPGQAPAVARKCQDGWGDYLAPHAAARLRCAGLPPSSLPGEPQPSRQQPSGKRQVSDADSGPGQGMG